MDNNFERPTERVWETSDDIVKKLLDKKETNPKNFTEEDEENLSRHLSLIEEHRSSNDANEGKPQQKTKDHFSEQPGHYL